MTTTMPAMARKKQPATDEPKKPATETVRIEADLAEMLTHIAIRRRKTVSEILSPQIRSLVERMYDEVLAEMRQLRKP